MKLTLTALTALTAMAAFAALLLTSQAHAQSTAAPAAPVQAPSPDATSPLYVALGEKPGITALMDDFVNRLREDARIGAMFKEVKPAYLKQQLTDQICLISGGPCAYEGEEMKKSHADLKIDRANFNALVEVLQTSMAVRGIPFSAQNQLLARLAPMHRDIITVR